MRIAQHATTAAATLALAAGALTATAGSAQAAVGVPQILQGQSGFGVYCVQRSLDYFLDDPRWYTTPDGDFGPDTLRIVKEFQEQNKLQQDGEVGPLTGTQVWKATQMLIEDIEVSNQGGSLQTPWGVPLSHCYQVIPTTS